MQALTILQVVLYFAGWQALLPHHGVEGKGLGIVGGHEVSIEDFPYQVSMEYDETHSCGGSIIAPNWILTAAHCVAGLSSYQKQLVAVRAGTSAVELGGVLTSALSISYHDQYNSTSLYNDVALIELSESLTYTSSIQSVTLVDVGNEPKQNEYLTVSGWGTLDYEDTTLPVNLNAVQVPTINRAMCNAVYEEVGVSVLSCSICAGTKDKDSCQGDSGGPLVNKYGVQVGIVSWGIKCGESGYPGVYTNLADETVRDWIQQTTGLDL